MRKSQDSHSIGYKLGEYVNNVKLYLHTEFEKRYDKNKKKVGRAVSAIKAVGGTVGHMIFGTVINLITSKFKKAKCLNRKGKSESVCEFISRTFMMSINYIDLLAHENKFFTAKQAVELHNVFTKISDTLVAKTNVSEKHFKKLEIVEETLERPLTKEQKQEVVRLSSPHNTDDPPSNSDTSNRTSEIKMKTTRAPVDTPTKKPINRNISQIKSAEQVLNRSLRFSEKRALIKLTHARRNVAKRRLKRKGFKSYEIEKLFKAGVL